MKLKLNCRTEKGDLQSWIYDNVTNEVWNPDGELVDLTKEERLKEDIREKSKYPESYPNNKSNELYDLRIQMGLKCNMNCRYCAQSDRKNEKIVSGPKDVEPLMEMLEKGNIKIKGVIELWGGEPFVYWKTVQKLVPALRLRYPTVRIAMVTNGTLLDEEKIDFCEKYGVSLTFSHDGQGYYLRGKDPLDDPKMVDLWRLAFSKLHCGINCVLTPANTDIDSIANFFVEKLGNIHLNFEGIMTHLGVQDQELMFTPQQILALQKNIYKSLTRENWSKFPALTSQAQKLLIDIVNRFALPLNAPKCCMHNADNAAINMKGDVLSCHDFCTEENFVGRIEEMDKVDISKHFKPWNSREKCQKCLVLSQCRGACPQIEGLARTLTCKNEFNYHFAIFQAVWWLLFGLTIESYEAIP